MKRKIVIEDDKVLLSMYHVFLTMEDHKTILYTEAHEMNNWQARVGFLSCNI